MIKKQQKRILKEKTDWDHVAHWYMKYLQDDTDSYHAQVIIPNLIRLLGTIEGKKIIDLGCGDGSIGHILAEKGATVVGVDGSATMIKAAEQKATSKESYHVCDVRRGLPLTCKASDICISVLAVQNMDMIHKVFSFVAQNLVVGGTFSFVTLHPAFRIPQLSDWYFDERRKKQGRVTFTYMSESKIVIDQHPGKKSNQTSLTFHRPLQTYSKILQNNGFLIKRIEEWCSHKKSRPGPRQHAEDVSRKEIPMFLYIEAVRVQ